MAEAIPGHCPERTHVVRMRDRRGIFEFVDGVGCYDLGWWWDGEALPTGR